MRRLILVALFLEVGLLLVIVPWSAFWDRNYFAHALPLLESVITNNYVRGAVSGLGIVNVYLGIVELVAAVTARHPPPSSIGASSYPSGE